MLSINLQPYASDALEDAMRLAQTKALNSYSWSDMLNYLNYSWMTLYHRIISIDSGYYSKTVQLKPAGKDKPIKIPPYVKDTINVYGAKRPTGYNRDIFRRSGMNDLQAPNTYHLSGFDLYCPTATYRTVWLEYVPMQPMLFFTKNNRDPKLFEPNEHATVRSADWQLYKLHAYKPVPGGMPDVPIEPQSITPDDLLAVTEFELKYKDETQNDLNVDISDIIFNRPPDWKVCYISCEYPYIFVTYKHAITDEYHSGFYLSILSNPEFIEYNPFAYTGKNSNVEYVETHWNDKTGMGVVIADWNDLVLIPGFDPRNKPPRWIKKGDEYYAPKYKELGWTPDTLLTYPAPEMYRYLVAILAEKLAALNESEVMGVSKELVEAKFAFEAFLAKDKSAWVRLTNVNGPTLTDML
jgi:hypothetical protein